MIPQPITLFLPWIATALASWLLTDKLSQLVNGLIIAALFALSVVLCILTSGTPLTSLSVSIVIGYSAGVFALMKPLMDYVSLKLPSPLAALVPAPVVVDAMPPAPVQPRAITLPSGRQFIPGVSSSSNGTVTPPPPPGTNGTPPTNG